MYNFQSLSMSLKVLRQSNLKSVWESSFNMHSIISFGIWFELLVTLFDEVNSLNLLSQTITLPQGRIRGTHYFIDGYISYLGIPYATVKERFQAAGDPPTWKGTFRADRESTCKQYSPLVKSIIGSENCLTANVYTPSRITNPLPVIVFIHGGGFYWGSNNNFLYNPRYLVKKDVVVVNINYRLGAFGFLCLKNKGAPGNVGLRDQITALKWVKNNIAYFGGIPESVTLFGEGSGASSIIYLILTQSAKGLFHRAIADSSTANTPQLFNKHPIECAVEVTRRMGYDTTDTEELLKIFQNSTADAIVSASYVDSSNDALAPYTFTICKEDPFVSDNPIVTKNPQELLDSVSEVTNISIIMGYNNKEGIMWAENYDNEGLEYLDSNFTSAIPKSLTFNGAEGKALFIKAVREFYLNNSSTNYISLIDYFSDALSMFSSVKTMEAFLTNPNIKMFNYYFTHDSPRNLNKLLSQLRWVPGANHADELFSLFDALIYELLPTLPSDLEFIDTMTSLWTNFAKTGLPSTAQITWKASESKLKFLKLDDEIEMIDLPNKVRIDFWKGSEEKYGLRYP